MCSDFSWKDPFFRLPVELCDPEKSRVMIIPAPYEGSVSYGAGAAKGPFAIFKASQEVEQLEPELGLAPAEAGISHISPLALEGKSPEAAAKMVEGAVAAALKQGKRPVVLGGEHSLSAGAIKAVKDHCKEFTVLHFDAHADLREEFRGARYSHACVMKRVMDLGVRAVSVGVRSLSPEEWSLCREKKLPVYFMHRLKQVSGWEEMIVRELSEKIYITLDLDVLDPACLPGTGTPEPDGMSYRELFNFLRLVAASGKELLGFDLVELAPIEGEQVSEFTAARLLHQMIGMFYRGPGARV
jgi:agmatinase